MYLNLSNRKVKKDIRLLIDSLENIPPIIDSDYALLLNGMKDICIKCYNMPLHKLVNSSEVTLLKNEFDILLKEILVYICTRSLKCVATENFYTTRK